MTINKFLISLLIIFSIFMFSSCNFIVDNENSNNVIEAKGNEIVIEHTILEDNSSGKLSNDVIENEKNGTFSDKWYAKVNGYGIAPSELNNNDMVRPDDNTDWIKSLKIRYPQIYNMKNNEKEKLLNNILFKEVINYHDVLENREYTEYSVDYKIMEANNEIISILFTGEVSDHHISNRFAHAITVNINSERKLDLEEFYVIDKSFIKNYLYTKFEIVDNNFEDMEENTPYIKTFVESYSLFSHENDFYIMGNDIGIIVPTHNSMGYILMQGKIDK